MEQKTIIIIGSIIIISGIVLYYYYDDIKGAIGYTAKKDEFTKISKKKIKPLNINIDKINDL